MHKKECIKKNKYVRKDDEITTTIRSIKEVLSLQCIKRNIRVAIKLLLQEKSLQLFNTFFKTFSSLKTVFTIKSVLKSVTFLGSC